MYVYITQPKPLNGKKTRADVGEMTGSGFSEENQKKQESLEEIKKKNNQEDWKNLAKVLDRIGLVVSIVYFIFFIIVLFTYKFYP